jgi:hypothetical protein
LSQPEPTTHPFPLNERELSALISLANVGYLALLGPSKFSERTTRDTVYIAEYALDELGADGWHAFHDRVKKFSAAHWPHMWAFRDDETDEIAEKLGIMRKGHARDKNPER